MDIQGQIDKLEQDIYARKVLRDAQPEESLHWQHFQDQITERTNEMLAWERAQPALEQIERGIESARRRVAVAVRDSRRNEALTLAKSAAVVGVLLLIVCLLADVAWWMVALCLVALIAAGGLTLLGTGVRRQRGEMVAAAEAQLQERLREWNATVPGGRSWTKNAPVLVGEQAGAFGSELDGED